MLNDILTLHDILTDTTDPPPPIIDDGILLEKTILLIYGQPKSRKTFLALNMALGIAQGKSFAGFNISNPRKVLYLSAEGGYFPTRDRIQKMCLKIEERHVENFLICPNTKINLCDRSDCADIRRVIGNIQPQVVILDPLIRFHSADENTANQMAAVFTLLRELIEQYSLSIIIVHHEGKDEYRGARGSSAIAGEYDSRIQISTKEEVSTLEFDMRHVATPDKRTILFNEETFLFQEAFNDPIVQAMKLLGGSSEKPTILEILQEKEEYSQSRAYELFNEAVKKGLLIVTEQGTYSLS